MKLHTAIAAFALVATAPAAHALQATATPLETTTIGTFNEAVQMGDYTFGFANATAVYHNDGTVTAMGEVTVDVAGFTLRLTNAELLLERIDKRVRRTIEQEGPETLDAWAAGLRSAISGAGRNKK